MSRPLLYTYEQMSSNTPSFIYTYRPGLTATDTLSGLPLMIYINKAELKPKTRVPSTVNIGLPVTNLSPLCFPISKITSFSSLKKPVSSKKLISGKGSELSSVQVSPRTTSQQFW